MRIFLIFLNFIYAIFCIAPSLAATLFYPHGYYGFSGLMEGLLESTGMTISFFCYVTLAILYMIRWKKPELPYNIAVWALALMVVVMWTGIINAEGPILAFFPLVQLIFACIISGSIKKMPNKAFKRDSKRSPLL